MFTVYARLSMLTKKLALLDAVIGKTGPCMITVENVAWGASRAIDCLSSLVRHFENGGGNSADDAKRGDKIIEWIGVKGTNMSLSRLADRAAMNSMFANHPFGSNEALLRTLRFLSLIHILPNGRRRRRRRTSRPTCSPYSARVVPSHLLQCPPTSTPTLAR